MRSGIAIANSEPVFLIPQGEAHLTEYGKYWIDNTWSAIDRHAQTIRDIDELARAEQLRGPEIERLLTEQGVPVAITSGTSQYGMAKLIDHINGKTSFTMPATVAMALGTAAPTSTTTGATFTEATYTGYARVTIAGAGWNAATAATPSVGTNASTITFGNDTSGTNTLAGFIIVDSTTIGAGNSLWYGTLASVTISTTQTPPTVAAGSLSVSMTGT